MKPFRFELVACVLAVSVLVGSQLAGAQAPPAKGRQAPTAKAPAKAPAQTPSAAHDQATIKDIEATMGFVPQWMQAVSPALLPSFWNTMKTFEMAQTRLDMKSKQLIGLAVAAQIPCDYCVVYHTEVARMHGATDQEIQEAVGMAAVTRMGSTLLNGMDIDKEQFRRDLDRSVRNSRQQAKR